MKTSSYSWRLTDERKAALEALARRQKRSVAELLDDAVSQLLDHQSPDSELEQEHALRRAAAQAFGRIAGGDPLRAEQARSKLRERLQHKRHTTR